MAKRRCVQAGPEARAARRDNDDLPARRQDAPDLLQKIAWMLARLERVDNQDPIHGGVGQRHDRGVDQRGGRSAIERPVDHALRGRHERQRAFRLGLEIVKIGRGVANAKNAQPRGLAFPSRAQHAGNQPPRDLPKRRIEKRPVDRLHLATWPDHWLKPTPMQGGSRHARIPPFYGRLAPFGTGNWEPAPPAGDRRADRRQTTVRLGAARFPPAEA